MSEFGGHHGDYLKRKIRYISSHLIWVGIMVCSSIHKNSLAASFFENSMGLESDLAKKKEKKNYTHIVYHLKGNFAHICL